MGVIFCVMQYIFMYFYKFTTRGAATRRRSISPNNFIYEIIFSKNLITKYF